MKNLFLFLLTLSSINTYAQTNEEEAVKQTVSNLFTAMRNSDTSLLRSVFAPEAVLQTIAKKKDGSVMVRNEQVSAFVSSLAKPHTDIYDERIVFDKVLIDADLATVWTPYQFYIGTKFSHCGVNSFQLVKINGEWKIQYIIDTRRKENCVGQ